MDKYSNLSSEEKRVILMLADAAVDKDIYDWEIDRLHEGGRKLRAGDNYIYDAPGDPKFYQKLSSEGFITFTCIPTSTMAGYDFKGNMIPYIYQSFHTEQAALDYRDYTKKTYLRCWWEDPNRWMKVIKVVAIAVPFLIDIVLKYLDSNWRYGLQGG